MVTRQPVDRGTVATAAAARSFLKGGHSPETTTKRKSYLHASTKKKGKKARNTHQQRGGEREIKKKKESKERERERENK